MQKAFNKSQDEKSMQKRVTMEIRVWTSEEEGKDETTYRH